MKLLVQSHVAAREVEGEVVLLNLSSECYFGLDEVGACFWRAIAADPDFESAVLQVVEEYDVEEDTARQDLMDLVSELAELGLLERAS